MRGARVWLMALTLFTVAVTACSSHPDSPRSAPSTQSPEPRSQSASQASTTEIPSPHLPLDRYMLSDQQLGVVEDGQNAAVARCMRTAGFAYPQRHEPVVTPGNTRRYGLTLLSSARRFGYHPPPELLSGQRWTKRLDDFEAALEPAAAAALTGSGAAGGCVAAGDASRGLTRVDSSVVFELGAQALSDAQRDPRAQAATKKWAACMAEAGHRYASPEEAMSDRAWWSATSPRSPTKAEISTAISDVECKRRTDYVRTLTAVESSLQRAVITEHKKVLERIRRYNVDLVQHAERLAVAASSD